MSSIRYKIWVSHSGPKGASILPKLKSPPSTVEAFRENVKRAHFQACICNLYCNRIHQSWIHMSLDGHPKDHQVLIAQCHYHVKLKLPLQIYLKVYRLQQQQQRQAMLLANIQLFICAAGLFTVLQL